MLRRIFRLPSRGCRPRPGHAIQYPDAKRAESRASPAAEMPSTRLRVAGRIIADPAHMKIGNRTMTNRGNE